MFQKDDFFFYFITKIIGNPFLPYPLELSHLVHFGNHSTIAQMTKQSNHDVSLKGVFAKMKGDIGFRRKIIDGDLY